MLYLTRIGAAAVAIAAASMLVWLEPARGAESIDSPAVMDLDQLRRPSTAIETELDVEITLTDEILGKSIIERLRRSTYLPGIILEIAEKAYRILVLHQEVKYWREKALGVIQDIDNLNERLGRGEAESSVSFKAIWARAGELAGTIKDLEMNVAIATEFARKALETAENAITLATRAQADAHAALAFNAEAQRKSRRRQVTSQTCPERNAGLIENEGLGAQRARWMLRGLPAEEVERIFESR